MEDLGRLYLSLDITPDFAQWGMDQVLQWHKNSLARYGVVFDNWFSEKKELHNTGLVAQTIEDLKKSGLTYEKEGALWIKVSEYGAPKDEVLVKSDGSPAYFAADIAYHLGKFKRGFSKLVDIWGPDHHGHVLRMTSALKAAKCPIENFMVLISQQVNLLEGGEKVKMSKREGKFVTMDELLEKAGKDAARFFFVMRGANSHLDFDVEIAKKQTDENPVFYVQYAHARICSLLKKTGERGFVPVLKASGFGSLREEEAFLLLKELMDYPQWVAESGRAYEPHRMVVYLQTLAADFHLFYSKHRILDAPKEVAEARLGLALGVKNVIRNALSLIGVSAPEQM
ncbi:MAG TPA: arginine--tRNA ligase, partial [bacterium]